jgi:hypothetical protein
VTTPASAAAAVIPDSRRIVRDDHVLGERAIGG